MMTLRRWQQETLAKVKGLLPGTRLCIQAPTGAGKNIFLQVVAQYYLSQGKKVLLIVDRVELVNDLQQEANNLGISYDIYTTQKTGRRKLATGYDVYLIDEAHSKYPSVIKSILAQEQSILIGVTATALTKGLGKIYGKYAYVPITFQEMVNDGTLIAPTFVVNDNLIDTSKLKTTAMGEYDLGTLVLSRTIIGDINQAIDKYLSSGRQCLILAPNQTEALNIKNNLEKSCALYISESKELFEDFKANKVQIVITVYALSKGFNHPNIGLIIDARPLKKSITEFIQGAGRGTRKMEGKDHFIYLDMCGNYFRFQNQYNKWRVQKRVKLNVKTRECINCEYDFLKNNIPAKCPEGGHLTYDEMICSNKECFVDFITEDMTSCPACSTNLIHACLKCSSIINVCNRICPHCFAADFKIRTKKEMRELGIEYKSGAMDEFRTINVDFTEIEAMDNSSLGWMILKTSYAYAMTKKKNIMRTAPLYAHTLMQSLSDHCESWKDKSVNEVYKVFARNYDKIATGEFNYYIAEKLKKELTSWWKNKEMNKT